MNGMRDRQAASQWSRSDPHHGGNPTRGRAMEPPPSCWKALQANQNPGIVRSAVGVVLVLDQVQRHRPQSLPPPDLGVDQPLRPSALVRAVTVNPPFGDSSADEKSADGTIAGWAGAPSFWGPFAT